MTEGIEVINPIDGKPLIINIEEEDWENNLAIKTLSLILTYTLVFEKDEEGNISVVFFEEIKD